jgi:hypothetical protein
MKVKFFTRIFKISTENRKRIWACRDNKFFWKTADLVRTFSSKWENLFFSWQSDLRFTQPFSIRFLRLGFKTIYLELLIKSFKSSCGPFGVFEPIYSISNIICQPDNRYGCDTRVVFMIFKYFLDGVWCCLCIYLRKRYINNFCNT